MNNVVIFAMLFMIVLFNLKTFLPESSTPASRPLVPQDGYILRIEQDGFALERAGPEIAEGFGAGETAGFAIDPEPVFNAKQIFVPEVYAADEIRGRFTKAGRRIEGVSRLKAELPADGALHFNTVWPAC